MVIFNFLFSLCSKVAGLENRMYFLRSLGSEFSFSWMVSVRFCSISLVLNIVCLRSCDSADRISFILNGDEAFWFVLWSKSFIFSGSSTLCSLLLRWRRPRMCLSEEVRWLGDRLNRPPIRVLKTRLSLLIWRASGSRTVFDQVFC